MLQIDHVRRLHGSMIEWNIWRFGVIHQPILNPGESKYCPHYSSQQSGVFIVIFGWSTHIAHIQWVNAKTGFCKLLFASLPRTQWVCVCVACSVVTGKVSLHPICRDRRGFCLGGIDTFRCELRIRYAQFDVTEVETGANYSYQSGAFVHERQR